MAEEKATRKTKKRRLFLINPRTQFRIILPVAALALAFGLLAWGLVFFLLARDLASEPDPGIRAILEAQLGDVQVRLLPVLLFATFLAAAYALVLSHRIAGPLARLARILEQVGQGNYDNLRFRREDHLGELETLTRQLAQQMKSLEASNRDVLMALEGRLQKLALRLDSEVIPKWELKEALTAMQAQLQKARGRAPAN